MESKVGVAAARPCVMALDGASCRGVPRRYKGTHVIPDDRSRWDHQVHEVRPEEIPSVYGALARAFEDDPVTAFLFPDFASRISRLRAFYRVTMPMLYAHGRFYADEGLRAGAVWQRPLPPRVGPLQTFFTLARTGLVLRGRARAGLALARAIEAMRVRRPHWYLGILGTQPADQERGLGSALITPVLQECDRTGELAYLESSKAANIPFYERHGFEVMSEVRVPGGPALWPMLRKPRGAGA